MTDTPDTPEREYPNFDKLLANAVRYELRRVLRQPRVIGENSTLFLQFANPEFTSSFGYVLPKLMEQIAKLVAHKSIPSSLPDAQREALRGLLHVGKGEIYEFPLVTHTDLLMLSTHLRQPTELPAPRSEKFAMRATTKGVKVEGITAVAWTQAVSTYIENVSSSELIAALGHPLCKDIMSSFKSQER